MISMWEVEIGPPELEEIQEVVLKMENNKVPGTDRLPAELFKTGTDELYKVIYDLIFGIIKCKAVICPLF